MAEATERSERAPHGVAAKLAPLSLGFRGLGLRARNKEKDH